MARNVEEISKSGSATALAENLKRTITELCVLYLLSKKSSYIGEITDELSRRSSGFLNLVCPYGLIYRLIEFEYIEELKKKRAPDGRRRQYYEITDKGRVYLGELIACYRTFLAAMDTVLDEDEPFTDGTP